MNIMYLIMTELWEDINNTTCYVTYNCQLALSICPFAFPFTDWWWVQALPCIRHNQKEETGSIKGGSQEGLTGRMRATLLGVLD